MNSANNSLPAAQSSCDPSDHVRHLEKDSLQRFLIVLCIIAALFMAAIKPTRSASTDAEQWAGLTITAR
jgi:hypothetical protein